MFEWDLLKTNEQTFVYVSPPPPQHKPFGRITFKLGKSPYFKALFQVVSVDIRLLLFIQLKVENGKVY